MKRSILITLLVLINIYTFSQIQNDYIKLSQEFENQTLFKVPSSQVNLLFWPNPKLSFSEPQSDISSFMCFRDKSKPESILLSDFGGLPFAPSGSGKNEETKPVVWVLVGGALLLSIVVLAGSISDAKAVNAI